MPFQGTVGCCIIPGAEPQAIIVKAFQAMKCHEDSCSVLLSTTYGFHAAGMIDLRSFPFVGVPPTPLSYSYTYSYTPICFGLPWDRACAKRRGVPPRPRGRHHQLDM